MDPQSQENARFGFATYKNYLLAISYLLDDYGSIRSKLKDVQQKQNLDLLKIKSLLMNSWNSELLLNFPSLFNEDFLKFSNHWSPVQSYYAIYLACRALIVAKSFQAKGDHATTLEIIVSNFIQMEKLFPYPWNILFDARGYKNTPNGITPTTTNPLENPYHFRNDQNKLCSSFRMFLKTTFERIIEEKCSEWKEKRPIKNRARKRLSPGIRQEIADKQRGVSIFDCFYRLRIRSNYKDVDIFILGSSAPETTKYFKSLCNITDKTLFIIENYLLKYIGKQRMEQIIDEYESADNLGIINQLEFSAVKRRQYYD